MTMDSGDPPRNSTTTVFITVIDANDNTPIFVNHSSTFTVPEDAGNDTHVATLDANDRDIGQNGLITYKIQNGDFGKFRINSTVVRSSFPISVWTRSASEGFILLGIMTRLKGGNGFIK